MKKEKNAYITPLLTVVEFKAERGYLASQAAEQINWMIEMETSGQTVPTEEAQTMEDERSATVGYWGGYDDHTWF